MRRLRSVAPNCLCILPILALPLLCSMWALAVLEHKPDWVLGPLLCAATDALSTYAPGALHQLGWACGKLGFRCVGVDRCRARDLVCLM